MIYINYILRELVLFKKNVLQRSLPIQNFKIRNAEFNFVLKHHSILFTLALEL